MASKQETRGGKREGSGRPQKPPKEYSAEFRSSAMRSLKRKAKELGFKDPLDALADLALNGNNQDTVRLGAFKLYVEMHQVKESHSQVELTTKDKPMIYLPEVMPKPQEAVDHEKEALGIIN